MTREEAIKYLIKPTITSTFIGEEKQKELEAYNMAIEALELIQDIPEIPKDFKYDTETREFLVYRHKYTGEEIHIIKPTSTYIINQQKEGHWIKYQEPWGGMQGWKCSNCENHYDVSSVYTIIPYNYCPNCGAKMKVGN